MVAATASDMVHEVAPYIKDPLHGVKQVGKRLVSLLRNKPHAAHV